MQMNVLKGNWICVIIVWAILLPIAVVLWPFRFSYDSFCTHCGAEQFTTEWQLPGCDWTFFRISSVKATPLSQYVTSSHLAEAGSHDWLFAHGGGNGVRCALGSGDRLRDSVQSANLVRFLQLVREFGGEAESKEFLRLALDPEASWKVSQAGLFLPENGFSTVSDYRSWISENDLEIEKLEAASKKKF